LMMFSSELLAQEYISHYQEHIKGDYWKAINGFVQDIEGNILIAGSFEEEISIEEISYSSKYKKSLFVASFDSIGKLNWMRVFDSPGFPSFIGIQTKNNKDFFLVGSFKDSLFFDEQYMASQGSNNIFYLLLNSDGVTRSSHILLDNFQGRVLQFRLDSMNHFSLGGEFKRSLILGNVKLSSNGKEDIFILSFDSEDKCTIALSFGGKGSDRLKGMVKHGKNELVYGIFEKNLHIGDTILNSTGQADVFLARFTSSWQMISSISIGGSGLDDISVVYPYLNNELLLGGSFKKTLQVENELFNSNGGKDIFLLKLSDSFELINSGSWGGRSDDFPLDISMDQTGKFFLSGIFKDEICFGIDTLNSSGRFSNGFIVCFSDTLGVTWTRLIPGDSEVIPRKLLSDGKDIIYAYGTFHKNLFCTATTWKSVKSPDIFLFSIRDPCSSFKLDLPPAWYLCPGGEDTLKAPSGFSTYLWNDGISDILSILVSEPGLYWLQVSDEYGCTAVDTLLILRDSLMVFYMVSDESLPGEQDGSIELVVSGGVQPYSMLWEDGLTGNFIGSLSEGSYNVVVSDSAGCSVFLEIDVARIYASGILDIQIFPNPMGEMSRIVYSLPSNTWMEIALFDVAGRKLQIIFSRMNKEGKYELEWDPRQLEDGVYYIRIQTNKGSVSRKLIIAHD